MMDKIFLEKIETSRLVGIYPGEDLILASALRWMEEKPGLILDLGAAEGQLESLLNGRSILAYDASIKLLKWGKERMIGRNRFLPLQGDLFTLPFKPGSIPLVVSLNTIENYTPGEARVILDEMLVLLKPGGRLVVSYRGGASLKMRYWETRHFFHGGRMQQYRFRAKTWLRRLNPNYKWKIEPLLRQPHGWRRWLGTPADAHALMIVDRIN